MSTIPPPWGDNKNWTLPDGKFKPGQSGNPAGKPVGTKNKRTLVAEVLEQGVEDVARAMLTEAKNGDVQAAKLVLERIVPPLRNEGPRVEFDLSTDKPFAEQGAEVLKAVSLGKLDPSLGKMLIECLSAVAGLREHDQFGARLAQLEQEVRDNKNSGAPGAVLQNGNPA